MFLSSLFSLISSYPLTNISELFFACFVAISLGGGDFDVNAFARTHFEGGGHINAAGGKSNLSMQTTIKKFEEILKTMTVN